MTTSELQFKILNLLEQKKKTPKEKIIEAAVKFSGYKEKVIFGKTRKHEVLFVRVCIAIALNITGIGYSEIGRIINKDHATVMYYCKTLKFQREIKKLYHEIFTRFITLYYED